MGVPLHGMLDNPTCPVPYDPLVCADGCGGMDILEKAVEGRGPIESALTSRVKGNEDDPNR